MGAMALSIKSIWACSIAAQLIVLFLLISKENFRKVPFFSTYVCLNLGQAGSVLVLLIFPWMSSQSFTTYAWVSECVTLLAQALATTEILAIVLRPYAGIRGLGWRVLAVTSSFVIVVAVLVGRGHTALEGWFELNRGYHLTFATALILCLLLIRYYSIRVPSAYKMILAGFCLNSCVEVLVNTVIQLLFHKGFAALATTWQFLTTLSFVVVLGIWVVALRKPFPADERQMASLLDSDYQRLSPEINEQLRLLNEKLLRLWKLEARSH